MTTPLPLCIALSRSARKQFTLRTMFVVVTVFALWLGWELRRVRERQALVEEIKNAGGQVATIEDFEVETSWFLAEDKFLPPEEKLVPPRPLFWRRWLGDRSVVQISGVPAGKLHEKMCEVFPERRMATDVEFNRGIELRESTSR